MADKKQTAEENDPLDPVIVIDMSARPAHTDSSRYLAFEDHAGRRKSTDRIDQRNKDIAQAHRFYVRHDLLPRLGICAA